MSAAASASTVTYTGQVYFDFEINALGQPFGYNVFLGKTATITFEEDLSKGFHYNVPGWNVASFGGAFFGNESPIAGFTFSVDGQSMTFATPTYGYENYYGVSYLGYGERSSVALNNFVEGSVFSGTYGVASISGPAVTQSGAAQGVGQLLFFTNLFDPSTGEQHFAQVGANVYSVSSSIPEPSTWAMMLVGFAGLGFAGYRAGRGAKTPLGADGSGASASA